MEDTEQTHHGSPGLDRAIRWTFRLLIVGLVLTVLGVIVFVVGDQVGWWSIMDMVRSDM